MFGGRFISLAIFAATVLFQGCQSPVKDFVSSREFNTDRFNNTLFFDLRSDQQPVGGLAIHWSGVDAPQAHSIVLPLKSAAVQQNASIFTASGRYQAFTIIHFVISQPSGNETVEITPAFEPTPDGVFSVEELRTGVYFMRLGNERRFVFKPELYGTGSEWPPRSPGFPSDNVDALAVAIPLDATAKAVQKGRLERPNRIFENAAAAFYPATGDDAHVLEIRYDLPPTPYQTLVLEYGLKFFGAVFVPLLSLFLLSSQEITKPKLRYVIIWVGIAVEVVVLIFVWRIAFVLKGENLLKTSLDISVTLAGGVATAFLLLAQRKSSR